MKHAKDSTSDRTENNLLLYCARTFLSIDTAERVRALLGQAINWPFLVEKAVRHGVAPLLFRSLCSICPEAVPQSALNQLGNHYRANVARNLFLTGELLRLMKLLEAHGISVTPFKGPVLAIAAYKELSLREFTDLDLVVRRCDIISTKELLIANGYRSLLQMNRRQEAAFLRSRVGYDFFRYDHKVVVELHWAFRPKWAAFPLYPEMLWDRRVQIVVGGSSIACVPPEEMLLILCAHGATHLWERLLWICDVAELIRSNAINWDKTVQLAKELNNMRTLSLGLGLAHRLLDAPIPLSVLDAVKLEPPVAQIAFEVRGRLFSNAEDISGVPGADSRRAFLFVKLRERLRDKVRHALHLTRLALVPTEEDRAFGSVPGFLSFAYYLIRPIRLLSDTLVRKPMRSALGGESSRNAQQK